MPPHCGICGYPILGSVAEGRTCPRCIDLNPIFRSGRTLILHRGVGREIIRRLKYHGAFYLLPDIERIMRDCPWFADSFENTRLVPVPLHPRRLRERGFNQSFLLAERFAAVGRSLEVRELLVRVKDTKSQISLTRAQRQDNTRNAFELVEMTTLQKDRPHVVIDDVFTTGATLNACCQVLRRAGIRDLRILTLAHG